MTVPEQPNAGQLAALDGHAAGVAAGLEQPPGSRSNPHPRDSLEWWAWARWYVYARRKTAAAVFTAARR